MIKDITLGQYFPGESVLHKMDPRMKIFLTFFVMVNLFLAVSVYAYAFMILCAIVIISLSHIPLKLIMRGIKPLIYIIVFTTVLNMFSVPPNAKILWQFWIFKFSVEGITNSAFMIFRLILLVMTTSLLTYTTSPTLLTDGLERLFSPLKKIKVPVHDFAMMMTIALRFIPTLIEETDKIMSAQKARGADFESGKLIKRVKALIPVLIPLFVSAFRRAAELATAMECRCYRGDINRTRLKHYRLSTRDYLSFVFVCFMLLGIVGLNCFPTPWL